MEKIVWLINGIPGSGKTTTARELAKQLPRSAHIEGDSIGDLIISGKVSPGQKPSNEESRQIHLCVKNQCILAKSLAEEGFTPVIDYVIVNKERIDEYKNHLPEFTIQLVTLNPGIEKALERDKARPEKTVAQFWTHLQEEIKKSLSDTGLWVDNRTISIEETVNYILENQPESAV